MRPLLLAALALLAVVGPGLAGSTVNARGECASAIAPPTGAGSLFAILNAPLLPFREAAGGAQLAADQSVTPQSTVQRVLQWPVMILGGFGMGIVEMPLLVGQALVHAVTLGHYSPIPNDMRPLAVATVRPRFLAPVPDDVAARCGVPAAR